MLSHAAGPPDHLGLPEPPWIVGHRGAAGEVPENTLDSLLLALDQGADMVELDLHLTADDWLVASHDPDLQRMGGVDLAIETSSLDELKVVEISGPFRAPGRRRTLATLAEVLALLPAELALNLELKRRDADALAMATCLAGGIADRERIVISSFDWTLLRAVRNLLPDAHLAPLGNRHADPGALLAIANEVDAWGIHCSHRLVDRDLVAAARAEERPILVYTVNDAAAARDLFELGASGVFSDFPGRLRRQLETA